METRKIPFSLEKFLKRSWPILVVGIVLVFGIAYGLFQFAISNKNPRPAPIVENPSSTSTEPIVKLTPRKLDGLLVPEQEAALQAYAVMIENLPDARPLSGLSKANLVVEAPVEAGITRFMAIYDATTTADQIGPVRSARPYYVDLANGLQAVYAHVGGSPDALEKILSLVGFRNLDEFGYAKYFWRSSKRYAPHNAYTRTDLMHQYFTSKNFKTGEFKGWRFLNEAVTSSERGEVNKIEIPYGGSYSVIWDYEREVNRYTRRQVTTVQKDMDGSIVMADNVVVLLTDQQVLDNHGRLSLRTTGSGQAVLFRDGQRHELTWRRKAGEWLTFETLDGAEVFFEPGVTWLSLVTSVEMYPTLR